MTKGGAETFIMNVYRNINREKFQFIFMCHSNIPGEYDNEIKKLGGKIIVINKPTLLTFKRYIKNFKKVLEEEKISVVHSHVSFFSGIICYFSKKQKVNVRISHAHTAGKMSKNSIIRCIYENLMRLLINKSSTHKIACGIKAGNYIFKNNYQIIYNGVDLSKYGIIDNNLELKKEFNCDGCDLVIGHIGRFSPVKNHDFFLKIADSLNKRKVNYKIILVGTGELFEEFENKIRINKYKNIILTGVRDDISNILSVFDVFVMPSLYEGFPVTIIEALASGVPSVISNTITDEIDNINNCVYRLDLNNDINLWIETIIEAKKTKNVKNLIDENKKNLQRNGFSIDYATSKLEDIYMLGDVK